MTTDSNVVALDSGQPGERRGGDTATTTESHDYGIRATAHAPQIVQNDSMGKQALIVVLVMFCIISAIAVLAGYALGVGEARAENTATQVRQLNARVEVLQWELDKASAQLIEKGLIKPAE